ncbi:hypothetical protein [uncultured Aquabacterium sp.]|nr:hypothetical protein [uncultured Aquabacterium sp.]
MAPHHNDKLAVLIDAGNAQATRRVACHLLQQVLEKGLYLGPDQAT